MGTFAGTDDTVSHGSSCLLGIHCIFSMCRPSVVITVASALLPLPIAQHAAACSERHEMHWSMDNRPGTLKLKRHYYCTLRHHPIADPQYQARTQPEAAISLSVSTTRSLCTCHCPLPSLFLAFMSQVPAIRPSIQPQLPNFSRRQLSTTTYSISISISDRINFSHNNSKWNSLLWSPMLTVSSVPAKVLKGIQQTKSMMAPLASMFFPTVL